MRHLHLCASYFSCAPPCCKSRVTLARTDPLLTVPAAEAAANWHMRTPRSRYPELARGNDPLGAVRVYFSFCSCSCSSSSRFSLPSFHLLPRYPFLAVPFGARDALVFTPIHKLRIAVAPAEELGGASGKLLERSWNR